ncbi:hypothetical protein [Actinomadura latina]|uniref:Uncharacterized protein n=1 Tax=Actinomadura latina TaxID=163603 RepID=A0A846Z4T7_9ACTN|nr:hypothetical protein [Actinomadura latina]NKZ05784.1 hypothetical protein [Actinomadura latina]
MAAGKHSTTGVLTTMRNDRRSHLETLQGAVAARRKLACDVVERRGVAWVSVVGRSGRTVEVGCDYLRSGWWFTWADGRLIAPVRDVRDVVDRLARELEDV